jgi:RNA polymerase sigma-70 factor (ECF subfamily)
MPLGGTNHLGPHVADGSRSFDTPQGRDPTALAAVYRAHARYVWRVLRHCGVPDPDLDDAVQETFLVVFRRLPGFEARASLRTWIYAVAVRVAATRRRSQRREATRREHAGLGMHGAGAPDPEAELSKAEAAELVDRLLDELDAPKRTVFVLAELEGVKVPEISRILGVNPRTVHSRLRLARESFGSALRRMQAHEEGNRRVARLRPRPLLEQAANDRPPVARRKAAMAALAVRIEQGAMPVLAGWEGLALGSGAGVWGLPVAMIGAVGVMVAVAVASSEPEVGTRPSPSDVPHGASTSSPLVKDTPAGASTSFPSVENSPVGASTSSPSVKNTPTGASTSSLSVKNTPTGASTSSLSAKNTPTGASASSPSAKNMPTGASTSSSSSPTASTLAAETRLLEQARDALRRGDSSAALSALDAHAAEFPAGFLLDEARSTRLRALCAAGRSDEATALADRWAAGQRGSRWHDVVAASCR